MPAAQKKRLSRRRTPRRSDFSSVLLPERFAACAALHLRHPVNELLQSYIRAQSSSPRGRLKVLLLRQAGLAVFLGASSVLYSITLLPYHKMSPLVNGWRTIIRWIRNFQLFKPTERNFFRVKFTICSFFPGESVVYSTGYLKMCNYVQKCWNKGTADLWGSPCLRWGEIPEISGIECRDS